MRKATINTYKSAGYAVTRNLLGVFDLLRTGKLPSDLDAPTLVGLGIPAGDVYPVLLTLRCLQLINPQGHVTDIFCQLVHAYGTAYQQALSALLKTAYRDVFAHVHPALATQDELCEAFKVYQPAKQRPKMVTLFRGLSREAGLVVDVPSETAERPYALLHRLLRQLPSDNRWTRQRRDTWLQAVAANVDLLVEVEEGKMSP